MWLLTILPYFPIPAFHLEAADKQGHDLAIWGQSPNWGTFSLYSRDPPGLGGWLFLLVLLSGTPETREPISAQPQVLLASALGDHSCHSGGDDQTCLPVSQVGTSEALQWTTAHLNRAVEK